MWKKAMWVGVPREEIEEKKIYQGDMNGRFAYYRLEIELEEAGEAIVDLSANSRYRLWINEKPVLSGPCRSNQFRHYYETVDLKPYLKKGKNVLAVRVLRYPTVQNKGCFGIYRTEFPGFFAEGRILDDEGKEYSLDARDGWKVRKDENFHIVSESELFAPLQILENTRGALWQDG